MQHEQHKRMRVTLALGWLAVSVLVCCGSPARSAEHGSVGEESEDKSNVLSPSENAPPSDAGAPRDGSQAGSPQQAQFERGVAHFAAEPISEPWATETKQLLEREVGQPLSALSGFVYQPIQCRHHTCVLEFHRSDGNQLEEVSKIVTAAVRKLHGAGQAISASRSSGDPTAESGSNAIRYYFSFVRDGVGGN